MATYQPHQIYTNIANFSEQASTPIREFFDGHYKKGSIVTIHHSRVHVKTKSGLEFEIPLPTSMTHFMQNRYDETVVLSFADKLSISISEIPVRDISASLFLQIRNKLHGVKDLDDRLDIFFDLYKKDVITDENDIRIVGKMVANGLPAQPTTNETDTYGKFIFDLANEGYTHRSDLLDVIDNYVIQDSMMWFLFQSVKICLRDLATNEHNATHLSKMFMRLMTSKKPDDSVWYSYNHPVYLYLCNAQNRDTGMIYYHAHEFPLVTLDKKTENIMGWGNGKNPFTNWLPLCNALTKSLRSSLYQLLSASNDDSKHTMTRITTYIRPLWGLIQVCYLEYSKAVLGSGGKNPIPKLSMSILYNEKAKMFDYTIGGVYYGVPVSFNASQTGMEVFLNVYDKFVRYGVITKSIFKTSAGLDGQHYRGLVHEATKDTSWLVSYANTYTNQHYLVEPWMFEQYAFGNHFGVLETGTYGTLVEGYGNTGSSYFHDHLDILLKSQGADLSSPKYAVLYSQKDTMLDFGNLMKKTTVDLSDAISMAAINMKEATKALHTIPSIHELVDKQAESAKVSHELSFGVATKKTPVGCFTGFDLGSDTPTEVIPTKAGIVNSTTILSMDVFDLVLPSLPVEHVNDYKLGNLIKSSVSTTAYKIVWVSGGAIIAACISAGNSRISLRIVGMLSGSQMHNLAMSLGFNKKGKPETGEYWSLHVAVPKDSCLKTIMNNFLNQFSSLPTAKQFFYMI